MVKKIYMIIAHQFKNSTLMTAKLLKCLWKNVKI